MNFRTEFHIPPSIRKISLSSSVFTIGSCFAEVVGNQLKNTKLQVESNPFGTLFNPLSIFKTLEIALEMRPLDERLFVQNQGLWFHYDFHSSICGNTKEELQEKSNHPFKAADFLIITFGTAFAYRLHEPPTYVANCHKMPSKLFEKDLLSVKDICKSFAPLYQNLLKTNNNLQIILTVSPVRHTRDGISQNAVSKSILRAACYYLETDFENVCYFPSYELMMDDLRDYRFYKPDLIHPNEVAETYIFEKFAETYFDDALKQFKDSWQGIQKDLAHKPFNPASATHQQFLQILIEKLERLAKVVDVSEELATVRRKLR